MKKTFANWRIIVFLLAVGWIVYRFVSKNPAVSYTSVPMILTAVAVSLLKIVAVAAAILLVEHLVGKLKKVRTLYA